MSDLPLDGEIDQLPADVAARVAELARRASRAEGPVMTALNAFGGRIESWIAHLPKPARSVLDDGSARLLTQLYLGAAGAQKVLPDAGRFGHRLAAALSGAAELRLSASTGTVSCDSLNSAPTSSRPSGPTT